MRRTIEVDMSPEAVDQRLREMGQLYRLWLTMRQARFIGRAEDLGPARFKLGAPRSASPVAAGADEAEGGPEAESGR
jgi:hypothetical protein